MRILLFALLLLIISSNNLLADNPTNFLAANSKLHDKFFQYYSSGDYKNALIYNAKLKDASKSDPFISSITLYREATLNRSLGFYKIARESFSKAEAIRKGLNPSSLENLVCQLEAARYHKIFDDVNSINSIVKNIEGAIEGIKDKRDAYDQLQRELLFLKLEISIVLREFNKIPKSVSDIEKYSSAENWQGYYSLFNMGQALSPVVKSYLLSEYLRLLSMSAEAYLEKGSYEQALSQLNKNAQYITVNKIKKCVGLWQHNIAFGDYYYEKNDDPKAILYYKKAFGMLPMHKSHLSYVGIIKMAAVYGRQHKESTTQKMFADFTKGFNKYPGTGSANLFYKYKLESEVAYAKNEFLKSKERLTFILSDTLTLPLYHPERVQMLYMVYLIDTYSGYTEKRSGVTSAEDRLESMIQVSEKLYGATNVYLSFLNTLKASYLVDHSVRYDLAEALFKKDFLNNVVINYDSNHYSFTNFYNKLAKLNLIREHYEDALTYLNKATVRIKKEKGDNSYAGLKQDITQAEIYWRKGDIERSRQVFEKAFLQLDQLTNKEKDADYALILKLKASWELFNGNYAAAKATILKEEEFSAKYRYEFQAFIPENEDFWFDYYSQLGKFQEAGEKILPYKPILKTKTEQLYVHYKLIPRFATYYLLTGDYIEAEFFAEKAMEASEEIYGPGSYKNLEAKQGYYKLLFALGDYQKALLLCNETLEGYTKKAGALSPQTATVMADLADIKLSYYSDKVTAESLYVKSLEILKGSLANQRLNYGNICLKLVNLYIQQEKYLQAEKLLDEADDKLGIVLDKKSFIKAEIASLKGDIQVYNKQYRAAENNYNNSLRIYEQQVGKSHPQFLKVESKLARCYMLAGKYDDCIEIIDRTLVKYNTYINKLFPYLSERERLKFWNSIKNDFNFYNVAYLKASKKDPSQIGKVYNNALLTKAILLSSSIKTRVRIMNSNDKKLKNTFLSYIKKKELQIAVNSMSDKEISDEGIKVEELDQEINQLEKELSVYSELWDNVNETKTFTWQQIREALQEDEAAVEILRLNSVEKGSSDSIFYLAMTLTKESNLPKYNILSDGNYMETKAIKLYRNSMKHRIKDTLSYSTFLHPLLKDIGGKKKLFMSVDGVYNQLNLETLEDADGNFAIDKFNIILISNTKDLAKRDKAKPKEIPNMICLFGNPRYYPESYKGEKNFVISQLPGTDEEIRAISEIFQKQKWQITSFKDTTATEQNLKNVPTPKILHIATHGFFKALSEEEIKALENYPELNNPLLRSGLLFYNAGEILNQPGINYNFKDGILTAYEAMNISLENTELVVLSACETGLGEIQAGEGVFGLQRTFLVAGAQSLIMSLFKVNDEITQKMMSEFYQNWISGKDMRTAFIDAKKHIKSEYPDPISWGSFVIIGVQ